MQSVIVGCAVPLMWSFIDQMETNVQKLHSDTFVCHTLTMSQLLMIRKTSIAIEYHLRYLILEF